MGLHSEGVPALNRRRAWRACLGWNRLHAGNEAALWLACSKGHADVAQVLTKHGARFPAS